MTRCIFFGVFMFSVVLLAAAQEKVPLPTWGEDQEPGLDRGGLIAGGTLLGDLDTAEVELFLKTLDSQVMLDPEDGEAVVDERFIEDYFATRPDRFLVDPQNLISHKQAKELESFLEYHAADSAIEMFIYIFDKEESIPGEVREEEVVERHFSDGKPALITYYFLGDPKRTTIYLSPSLTDTVSATEQHRALQSSTIRAMKTRRPVKQLEEFLVQMSIRIYWMEQMLQGATSEDMERMPEGTPEKNFTAQLAASTESEDPYPQWMVTAAWIAGYTGFATCVLWGLLAWLRSRAKFVFPEFDVEPRLGGSHAAGVGAVVSFSSPAIPPARQRDQIPGYMRRA